MYGTGMNPYMLNHFFNVARNMNNYIVATSYYQHQNRYFQNGRDAGYSMPMYQSPSLLTSGLSSLFAYGLQTIGMPSNVVNFGYRLGYFIDINA
jgi:hypothetical protein